MIVSAIFYLALFFLYLFDLVLPTWRLTDVMVSSLYYFLAHFWLWKEIFILENWITAFFLAILFHVTVFLYNLFSKLIFGSHAPEIKE